MSWQAELQKHKKQGYEKLIYILFKFTNECLGMEKKFLEDNDARDYHFELFMNGYAKHKILDNDENFKDYNKTFDEMLYDLAMSMRDPATYFDEIDAYSKYAEIMNRLRFRHDLTDNAKRFLFKRVEEDLIEHKLDIEFDSGVRVSINISIINQVDVNKPYIDIDASFVNPNKKMHCKTKFVISSHQEDFDEDTDEMTPPWVNNDPVGWIASFVKSLEKGVGKKLILGKVKKLDYTYNGEQFWAKAYTLLEVLPKLWSA